MKGKKTLASVFGEFCTKMRAELPEARIFDDYFSAAKGFDIDMVEQALKEWSMDNAFRFPSPNELNESLVKLAAREDRRGQPKTVRDLFGNRVRAETPLARELRGILRQMCDGRISGKDAHKMADEAEGRHGFNIGLSVPRRKMPEECMHTAGVDEYAAKKAYLKTRKNEADNDELRKLARCLLPYGHFVLRASNKGFDIVSMDMESWAGSFDLLADYAERI